MGICAGVLVVALLAAACLSAGSQADYNKGYAIGLEAYTYGLPLIVTNTTFATMTSIDVSSGAFGPVNRFNNVRTLNNAGSTAVVAPGANSLSSIAWLDLGSEPQVLHVPDTAGRYSSVELIDPRDGTVFDYVGRRVGGTAAGDFLVTGPGWSGPVPSGTTQISSPNDSVFLIGRVLVEGDADLPAAYDLAKQFQVTSLDRWRPAP